MDRFHSISPEDKELVLRLGFACFDSASGLLNHDLQENYEKKLQDADEKYKTQIQRMKDERDTIVQERVNTALEAVRNERSRAIDTMCDTIQKNREHETLTMRKNIEELMGQMKELVQEHKRTNEGSAKEMKHVIETLRGSASNSAVRGKIGESTTELVLDKIIPGSTWENTSDTGGKADFQAVVPGIGKILMDIKNHEKEHGGVPARDRKKLLRDLDGDNDAVGAILVATQANIHSASHCQVIFTDTRKPMVCCLLHGDWERLRDAIETLRACVTSAPKSAKTQENTGEEAIHSLREILKHLCEQEKQIMNTRQNVVRAITEANIALSRIDPDWDPNLREWLMVHLKKTDTILPKDVRVNLKNLRENPDIPKEAKGKSGRDKLRDELQSLGVAINADGSMPNIKIIH